MKRKYAILLMVSIISFTTLNTYALQKLNVEEFEEISGRSYLNNESIIYNGNIYLANMQPGTYVSSDGLTWVAQPYSAMSSNKLTWDGEKFAVFTRDGLVGFSEDGYTWERQVDSNLVDFAIGPVKEHPYVEGTYQELWYIHDVIWTGEKYIGCSSNSPKIFSSKDGILWEDNSNIDGGSGGGRPLYTLCTNGEIYVAGGNAGRTIFSSDGVNWVDTTFEFKDYYSLNEEQLRRYMNQHGDFRKIIWTGREFIAIANVGTGWVVEERWVVFSSVDGKNWEQRGEIATEGGRLQDIVWSGEEFFILGQGGDGSLSSYSPSYILRTKDFIEWDKTIITDKYLTTMIWDGKQIIAVGHTLVRVYTMDIFMNDKLIPLNMAPITISDDVLVPIKSMAEACDLHVAWDSITQTTTINGEDKTMVLEVGSRTVYLKEEGITLDNPIKSVGGRLMVPLRFFAESFGIEIKETDDSNTVLLYSN